jgi:hypothetical protein
MKHTQLLLVLAFLFIKATTMGQFTTPPPNVMIEYMYLEKCGNYINGSTMSYLDGQVTISDSITITYNLYDILDTDKNNVLFSDNQLINTNVAFFNLNHINLLDDYTSFNVEVIAENNCGKDSLDYEYIIPSRDRSLVIPDTSTCEGYIPSYITGPTELTSCDKDAAYIIHMPMYDSLNMQSFFWWNLEGGGVTEFFGNNSDTIYLQELPSNNFTLSVSTWDTCSCDGFKTSATIIATLNVNVSSDSTCGQIVGQVYGDRPGNCFN